MHEGRCAKCGVVAEEGTAFPGNPLVVLCKECTKKEQSPEKPKEESKLSLVDEFRRAWLPAMSHAAQSDFEGAVSAQYAAGLLAGLAAMREKQAKTAPGKVEKTLKEAEIRLLDGLDAILHGEPGRGRMADGYHCARGNDGSVEEERITTAIEGLEAILNVRNLRLAQTPIEESPVKEASEDASSR